MDNKQISLDKMIKGGLMLTVSSFIVKLLSALYKVPFQNLTGDAGFYVYQQVYPLYGLAVAFTLQGLPTFISKVVSEAEDERQLQLKMREMNTWLFIIGVGLFALLWGGSNRIAHMMGDSQLAPAIKSISIFYLFLPFLALIRGYFQGKADMLPTSISQIVEQIVRVAVLLGAALHFTNQSISVYQMGANAYHSAWLSALAGTVVLGLYLKRNRALGEYSQVLKPQLSAEMGKRLVSEGGLLIATSSIMILFQFIDSFTVFNGLVQSGFTNEMAMSLKGVYDRGQPLVQLGLVVGLGFSTTSLPLLRRQVIENRWADWTASAASLLKITMILGGAATVGLVAVMPWMNFTLFTDFSGTDTLQIFVLSVFFASLIYCLHTILQSTGKADNSFMILLVGLGFKILANQLTVKAMGINGSGLVTVLSLLLITILLMQFVQKEVWQSVLANHFFLKLFGILIGLYGLVRGTMAFIANSLGLSGRFSAFVLIIIGALIGVVFFIITALSIKLLNEEELKQISLLSKLIEKMKRK